jgi:hypothetical protein
MAVRTRERYLFAPGERTSPEPRVQSPESGGADVAQMAARDSPHRTRRTGLAALLQAA